MRNGASTSAGIDTKTNEKKLMTRSRMPSRRYAWKIASGTAMTSAQNIA